MNVMECDGGIIIKRMKTRKKVEFDTWELPEFEVLSADGWWVREKGGKKYKINIKKITNDTCKNSK